MIVFVGGMPRSGSTFSFNIARDILERRGKVYQEPESHVLAAVERAAGCDHIVLKAHCADDITIRLIQAGAVKSVVTIRKPEDAIASWMETFGFTLEESVHQMSDWIEMFVRIRNRALLVPYDQIDRHPHRTVKLISKFLCGDVGLRETFGMARKYSKRRVKDFSDRLEADGTSVNDIGFTYYDTRTFFHRRHVSAMVSQDAVQRIGQKAVHAIRLSLGNYIDNNGELIPAEMHQASGRAQ